MIAAEILAHLAGRDVRLWTEAGGLLFDAPAGELEPPDLEIIRANKPALISMLGAPANQRWGSAAHDQEPGIVVNRPDPIKLAEAYRLAQASGVIAINRGDAWEPLL